MTARRRTPIVVVLMLIKGATALAAPPTTVPVDGLRINTPNDHALVGAKIVVAPGRAIAKGTIVLRDGVITAVGESVNIPRSAVVWDFSGRTVYAGFIDAYAEQAVEMTTADGSWNRNVTPQLRLDEHYQPSADVHKKLRSQGFTLRVVAPAGGIVKGTSAVVTTGDGSANVGVVRPIAALHVRLTPPRGSRGYPASPMGAVALIRQSLLDAEWYVRAWEAHRTGINVPRPETNEALAALAALREQKAPLVIDAPDVSYFLRADRLGAEFDLPVIMRGSNSEYQRLDAVRAAGRAVILPLEFPKPPNVADAEAATAVSLERLMHWDLAPENPGRLAAAGVRIALTTHGLKDSGTFLAALRKAMARGLTTEAALRALTTTPAELFGVANRYGTLEVGKSASLVAAEGDLFEDAKAKIHEVWIDGRRHVVHAPIFADIRGRWEFELPKSQEARETIALVLEGDPEKVAGKLVRGNKESPLKNVAVDGAQWSASLKGDAVDWPGEVQLSATILTARHDERDEPPGTSLDGFVLLPDGKRYAWKAKHVAATPKKDDEAKDAKKAEPPAKNADSEKKPVQVPKAGAIQTASTPDVPKKSLYPVNYPLGDFGLPSAPEQPRLTAFVGATVWTCDGPGRLEGAVVLVERGKIKAVGRNVEVPKEAVVIDARGMHLTPGIIDCHSHIATDGGVNEGTQSITAEVRIGDFVDAHDVNVYRQLAGGVTTANILHGSANTIGGQCQVVKFRWGALPEEMKFAAAPPSIKFALGENVKRSNFSGDSSRYPQTRMGVEQLLNDAFQAADDYRRRWSEYRKFKRGLPPRVDLELEALVEVLDGKRLVHCHSYRQDEILAFLRVCEAHHVRVATLQHILEGYKVAEVMAKHGAGGSSFSDWWAYKFEVFDAIPYNGALMHDAGVVVSFNSDDAELARRLNLEAAKAVKYGGVSPEEALKFVTLNPARQMGVDKYVGSITPGKDADLVLWSGSPLSTLSRCEQTWIDGRKYFDRKDDLRRRDETQSRRIALIQRILSSGEAMDAGDGEKGQSWARDDVYCSCRSPHAFNLRLQEEAEND